MKLVVAVLLLAAALPWADTSYQNFQTYQDQAVESSNYYGYQVRPERRVGGGLTGILQQYLNPIRRQGISGLSNFIGPLGLLFLLLIIALIFYGYYNALFNSSGRGLDTDEWEVDHSVWMDQLQKDFEDSWTEH